MAWLVTGLAAVLATGTAGASQPETPPEVMSRYEALMAEGEPTAAVKFLLDHAEEAYGENAPRTVRLTHGYGYLLLQDGEYRKAVKALKKALDRSIAAYGDTGGEAFDINLNLGYTYALWRDNPSASTRYFDRALEILRERGEHESLAYVTTLVNIVFSLMEDGGLEGVHTSNVRDYFPPEGMKVRIDLKYTNYFHLASKYAREAVELSSRLESEAPFLSAKIAIVQAKLNVMETTDLDDLPVAVEGYISPDAVSGNYDREEARLLAAIEQLARDTDANSIFLKAANHGLMEIAWLQKDEDRMAAMCASGALDSTSDYPPDRLYEIMPGGVVFAPEIGIRVSTDLFSPLKSRVAPPGELSREPVKKPYFKPVCINGRLMAALIHAPRVTVEELR